MKNKSKQRDYLKWFAGLIAVFTLFYFVIFLVGKGGLNGFHIELKFAVIMYAIAILGYLLSWLIEKIGGALMVIGGTGQATYLLFLEGVSNLDAVLLFSLPFCVPGILLLVRSKKVTKRKPSKFGGTKVNKSYIKR